MSFISQSQIGEKNATPAGRLARQGRSCFPLAALFVTGCASVGPHDAFQSVQEPVAELSGYRVAWNQGSGDDQKAEAAVQRLLQTPLDANTAAQVALLNNPDLQATFEEIGISQADLVQAGLLQNPTFFLSLRFPDQPPGLTDAEYSLTEDFLSLLIVPLKIKVAKANLEVTEERVTHEVVHLIGEVKETFYTYQAELQLEHRLQLIIQADQAGADLAQAQHDAGNLTDSQLVDQQMQAAGAHLALSEAAKQNTSTREKLNRLMGLWDDGSSWTARPSLPNLPKQDPPPDKLEALALTQRRDLLAARAEVNSIGEALALKTGTRFLPAGINIGVDTEQTPDSQRVTGPTLGIAVPIFDQGQGEVAKLSAQQRQARRRLQSLTLQVRSEVREARAMLKIDRDQVTYYQKVFVPLSLKSVNKMLLQFNAMETNTYDLLLAKQRELDTERDYIESWRDYWISHAQLEEAVGGSLRAPRTPPQP